MRKILIPTDFSKNSNDLIAFALDAFNSMPCVFYFLHAYQYKINGLDAIDLLQSGEEYFKKSDLKVFKKMIDQVSQFATMDIYSQHKFIIIWKDVDLIDGINETIENFEIDLILVGTKGEHSGTKRFKEKEVNRMVNEVNECPVLVVPIQEKLWKRIDIENIKMTV